MTMTPPEFAQRFATELSVAPVNISAIANKLGIPIYEKSLAPGVSGGIFRDTSTPSGFVIFVDNEESYVRQRFTAAHEIGHYILHQDKIGDGIEDNYLLRSDRLSSRIESEANRFAADLLMPWDLIKKLQNQGHKDVSSLARALKVSEVAMSIRLGMPT